MKKRFISLCLALVCMLAPASAAFSDISDSRLEQTASVLDALGIMQGVDYQRFSPEASLTRAQFCKLAVTAMGVSDTSAYGSYTIFPDVKSSHWASKYINAAVLHPDLKKQAIIRGYADGTFGPDKTVNFGEVCTMLLRMLGYTESDIGPFWPTDYIARAKSLGLTKGVSSAAALNPVKRADAATMLLNTLGTKTKDDSGMLLSKVASSTIEDCILLETSKTDSTLASNEARFFENGAVSETPRKTAGTLDYSLIGVHGTIVIGKDDENVVIGVVPNDNKVETYNVTSISADGVKTNAQTLHPNRDVKLYVARERKADTYANMWASVHSGDTLTMYYDDYGSLELMAVLPTEQSAGGNSFVYGMATSINIPESYTIVKNGAVVDRSKLRKYDVVTMDAANRRAIVSDAKLSGQYTSGTPSFNYPQTVTMYGQEYRIPDSAASSFKDLKPKDYITLLFDDAGNVAAAFPKTTVSADMQGIVTSLKGSEATVALTNGLTVSLKDMDTSNAGDLMGRMVSVGQNSNGKPYLMRRSLSGRVSGDWSVSEGKIGQAAVSPKARIYEEVTSSAPLAQISLSDLDLTKVPAKDIRYTVVDSAGTVTNIVLGDVTGDSWIYGMGFGSTVGEKDDENREYYAGVRYWDGSAMQSKKYPVINMPSGLGSDPIGIPRGYQEDGKPSSMTVLKLTSIDTVQLSAFDGATGVRTKNGYYKLADNIGVYNSDRGEFMSLQTAKANYTSFRVYANTSADDGGVIRMIVAE